MENFYENFFTMECEGINYNMFDKKETEKREKFLKESEEMLKKSVKISVVKKLIIISII